MGMWKITPCSRMLLVKHIDHFCYLILYCTINSLQLSRVLWTTPSRCLYQDYPHPNSVNTVAKIIPLTSSSSQAATTFVPTPESRLWAPFRTLADFEYTETAVVGRLSEDLVNRQLNGFCNKWSIGGSNLTIHTYKDMQKSLEKARDYGIKVSHNKPFWRDFDLALFD